MNNKKIITIVIVLVVIVAAAVTAIIYSNDDNESSNGHKSTATGRLLIYGNADNDDYLDEDDLSMIKNIVSGSIVWDKNTNPLADTDADGDIDQDDVDLLQKILNGEDCILKYKGDKNDPATVHFPVKGNIGVNYDYGYMITQTLGIYDRVTAALDRFVGYSENRYPGCHSFYNLGTSLTVEGILNADVDVILGNSGSADLIRALNDTNQRVDIIELRFNRMSTDGITPIAAVLMAGVIFQCEEKAENYVAYYDRMVSYIQDKASQIPESTMLMPYNTTSDVETAIDCRSVSGAMGGDFWTVS